MAEPRAVDPDQLRQTIALARERNRARETRLGCWNYLRFDARVRFIPEGTAVFGDRVVWGYPKIGRILQLQPGIEAQLQAPFWVEEKIDGYNVRLLRQDGDLLALTRRGYVCPFTTDRAPDFIDTRLFDAHPELVLCAEVAGPDNPYNEGSPPFIDEDVQFFVFDVMRQDQPQCLPHRDKIELVEAFGLPAVPSYGRFKAQDLDSLRTLILRLDREGREGIVLKEDSPEDRRVKYVTGRSGISDVQVNEGSLQQLPAEYFLQRVLRLALFLEEHDLEPTPAMYRELGEAFVKGTLDTIAQYRDRRKVCHRFRCRFRRRSNAELMLRDLKRRLGRYQVHRRALRKEGDYWVLEFEKVLPRTTGVLAQLLKGGIVYD